MENTTQGTVIRRGHGNWIIRRDKAFAIDAIPLPLSDDDRTWTYILEYRHFQHAAYIHTGIRRATVRGKSCRIC